MGWMKGGNIITLDRKKAGFLFTKEKMQIRKLGEWLVPPVNESFWAGQSLVGGSGKGKRTTLP